MAILEAITPQQTSIEQVTPAIHPVLQVAEKARQIISFKPDGNTFNRLAGLKGMKIEDPTFYDPANPNKKSYVQVWTEHDGYRIYDPQTNQESHWLNDGTFRYVRPLDIGHYIFPTAVNRDHPEEIRGAGGEPELVYRHPNGVVSYVNKKTKELAGAVFEPSNICDESLIRSFALHEGWSGPEYKITHQNGWDSYWRFEDRSLLAVTSDNPDFCQLGDQYTTPISSE